MIQETMCSCDKAREIFSPWLRNWSFNTIDASSLSGGLLTRWSPNFQALSSSVVCSTILVNLKHKNSDLAFLVVNIYGPYSDRTSFWEELVSAGVFHDPLLVVGGGFKFYPLPVGSLGNAPQGRQVKQFFPIFLRKGQIGGY
jgi:hypothetical protein